MCEPISITLAAIGAVTGIAGTIASTVGQAQAAQQQANYQAAMAQQQNQMMIANNQAAIQSTTLQYTQEQLRAQQEQAAALQQQDQINRDAQRAQATARVAAGEAGVSGLSVESLLADYDRQAAMYRDAVSQNQAWGEQQRGMTMKAIQAQGQNQANSMAPYLPQPVNGPNWGAAALQIGSTLASAGTQMHSMRPPKVPAPSPRIQAPFLPPIASPNRRL